MALFSSTSRSRADSAAGDVVLLNDGTRIEGTVLGSVPGRFVTVRTGDGAERTIAWDKIAEVSTAAPSSPPTAAGGEVRTSTTGTVDASGAWVAHTVDCTDAKGDPSCHREVTASADASGIRAQYATESDCGSTPDDVRCKERATIGFGGGGASASFKRESATKLEEPPSGAVNVGMDLGGGGLLAKEAGVGFVSLAMRLKFLAGGKFPGADGGGWSGLAFEPSLAGLLLFVDRPATSAYSTSKTDAMAGLQLGASIGWQYLSFGTMDKTTLRQSGFGLLLAGYLGATGISTGSSSASGSSSMVWSASYGPVIGLSFPQYNAGTSHYSAFNLIAMVLPTGDSGTLLSASLGLLF